MMPRAKLGDSKAQRCAGDHSQKCHLALSPENTLLPWKCVAVSIPIPGSLWEWQECQGDVNGDIRSHSHQPDNGTGQEGAVSCWGWGDKGRTSFLLWLIDVCSQVHI